MPAPRPLQQAFDDPEQPYLPDEVLFRQKEQFSDGVGYDWVDGLKEYANKVGGGGWAGACRVRWSCRRRWRGADGRQARCCPGEFRVGMLLCLPTMLNTFPPGQP